MLQRRRKHQIDFREEDQITCVPLILQDAEAQNESELRSLDEGSEDGPTLPHSYLQDNCVEVETGHVRPKSVHGVARVQSLARPL